MSGIKSVAVQLRGTVVKPDFSPSKSQFKVSESGLEALMREWNYAKIRVDSVSKFWNSLTFP